MKFQKGHKKVGGREKGVKEQRVLFLEALERVYPKGSVEFYEEMIREARRLLTKKNDASLSKELLKKMIPDQIEATIKPLLVLDE